jgi:hypothetical protein
MVEVVRSPAKVAWWVQVNGVRVDVAQTREEAEAIAQHYKHMLGSHR